MPIDESGAAAVAWGVQEWAILYGVLVSTAAFSLNAVSLCERWRNRDQIDLRFSPAGQGREGVFIGWLDLYVRNSGPNPIHVDGIEVIRQNGPSFVDKIRPFPCLISPFHEIKLERFPLNMLLDDTIGLRVVDGRGRPWELLDTDLRRAIESAKDCQASYEELGLTSQKIERLVNTFGERIKIEWRELKGEIEHGKQVDEQNDR